MAAGKRKKNTRNKVNGWEDLETLVLYVHAVKSEFSVNLQNRCPISVPFILRTAIVVFMVRLFDAITLINGGRATVRWK